MYELASELEFCPKLWQVSVIEINRPVNLSRSTLIFICRLYCSQQNEGKAIFILDRCCEAAISVWTLNGWSFFTENVYFLHLISVSRWDESDLKGSSCVAKRFMLELCLQHLLTEFGKSVCFFQLTKLFSQ